MRMDDLMEKVKDEERIEILVHGNKKEGEEDQVVQTKIVNQIKFKQFDVIKESLFTDHHYYNCHPKYSNQIEQRISDEWDMLRNGLPDSIFVRVNKGRCDLLRAVIIGPQGTPYHDGLFFLDMQFPSTYPNTAPKIYYRGLLPKISWSSSINVLQFLLSMHETLVGSGNIVRLDSATYTLYHNERIFKSNWRTMVSTLAKPPIYFEEFIFQHFRDRGETILKTCKAYISRRVNTPYNNHPLAIKVPSQEEFDEMECCYSKLVATLQKNDPSLGDLSRLGIEFHGEFSTTMGGRICSYGGLCMVIVFLVITGYYIVKLSLKL